MHWKTGIKVTKINRFQKIKPRQNSINIWNMSWQLERIAEREIKEGNKRNKLLIAFCSGMERCQHMTWYMLLENHKIWSMIIHVSQQGSYEWNKYGDLCNHHEHIIQINWHLQGLCILLRHIIRNEHKDETYSYLMYLGLLPVYLNCLFILIVKFLHIWNRHSLSINNYLRWWHNCSRELSIARYAPVEVGLAACPQLCHSQPEKISSLLICIMHISLSTSESMTA